MFDVLEKHPAESNGAGTMDSEENHCLHSSARQKKNISVGLRIDAKILQTSRKTCTQEMRAKLVLLSLYNI